MVPGGKIRDQGRPERERLAEVGEQVPLRPEWRQQTLFAWAAGVVERSDFRDIRWAFPRRNGPDRHAR